MEKCTGRQSRRRPVWLKEVEGVLLAYLSLHRFILSLWLRPMVRVRLADRVRRRAPRPAALASCWRRSGCLACGALPWPADDCRTGFLKGRRQWSQSKGLKPFEERLKPPQFTTVGWIAQGDVEPGSSPENAFTVRECLKASFAMIRALATCADSAKRQVMFC